MVKLIYLYPFENLCQVYDSDLVFSSTFSTFPAGGKVFLQIQVTCQDFQQYLL